MAKLNQLDVVDELIANIDKGSNPSHVEYTEEVIELSQMDVAIIPRVAKLRYDADAYRRLLAHTVIMELSMKEFGAIHGKAWEEDQGKPWSEFWNQMPQVEGTINLVSADEYVRRWTEWAEERMRFKRK